MPAWVSIITKVSSDPRVRKALWWVSTMVGLDKALSMAWKAIERGLSRIGERGMAIRTARHTKEGRGAAVVLEGRTRWIVYSGQTPIEIFPPIKGDLASSMATFDTSRLRE